MGICSAGRLSGAREWHTPASSARAPELPELYLGVDIGRKRDLTIAWLFEKVGEVLWSRVLLTMKGISFDEQEKAICAAD